MDGSDGDDGWFYFSWLPLLLRMLAARTLLRVRAPDGPYKTIVHVPGASTFDVKIAVAVAVGMPVDTFGLENDTGVTVPHAELTGDWTAVAVRGKFARVGGAPRWCTCSFACLPFTPGRNGPLRVHRDQGARVLGASRGVAAEQPAGPLSFLFRLVDCFVRPLELPAAVGPSTPMLR